MLKVTRRLNESILLTIGNEIDPEQLVQALREGITITLFDIGPHQTWARIGVHAPDEVRILRAELLRTESLDQCRKRQSGEL